MPKRTRKSRQQQSRRRRRTGQRRGKGEGAHPPSGLASSSVLALSGGFPNRIRVRLVYNQQVDVSAITAQNVFRGNGCHDPDVSGTGSQPYNWDDWKLQYNRYVVWGSSIKATYVSNSTTAGANRCYFIVCPRHESSSITGDIQSAMAAPYARHKIFSSVLGQAQSQVSISHRMSTQNFLGNTKQEVLSANQALTSADPTVNPWYWFVAIYALDASTSQVGSWFVRITYDIEFFDRFELTLDEQIARRNQMRNDYARYMLDKASRRRSRPDEVITTPASLTVVRWTQMLYPERKSGDDVDKEAHQFMSVQLARLERYRVLGSMGYASSWIEEKIGIRADLSMPITDDQDRKVQGILDSDGIKVEVPGENKGEFRPDAKTQVYGPEFSVKGEEGIRYAVSTDPAAKDIKKKLTQAITESGDRWTLVSPSTKPR